MGHVQKRLGKALRDLKAKHTGKLDDRNSIGGKGRLTDKLINTLQNYYGRAIRENSGDFAATCRASYASLRNRGSTDANLQHGFCPPGPDSWCEDQRMKVTGTEDQYKHHDPIPPAVFALMRPVYDCLADNELLSRCSRMATQNANECLNGIIWYFCPKESSVGQPL